MICDTLHFYSFHQLLKIMLSSQRVRVILSWIHAGGSFTMTGVVGMYPRPLGTTFIVLNQYKLTVNYFLGPWPLVQAMCLSIVLFQ